MSATASILRTRLLPQRPARGGPRRLLLGVALALTLATPALPLWAQSGAQPPAAEGCKQLLASGNPQYPPYLWRDPANEDQLIGSNAELMQWLAKEIGLPIETRYIGPWGRVQEEARAGRIDLIAGAFFTLPRSEYMDYFHPALRETRSVVLVRNESRLNYRRWGDLVGLQGVTVINNSFGEEFDRYARESLKITQVASLEQAIQMLQRSRADYLVYEDSPAAAYQARMNVSDIRPLAVSVANENLYLTLSHRSACNTPELRGKLARALYKLQRQNLMAPMVERAIQLWRRQSQ